MFLTSERRREGGDRPHTAADRCREVSPRGIYTNASISLLLRPTRLIIAQKFWLCHRFWLYIYKRAIMFSLLSRGNYNIYIYAASPSRLYNNPKLVGQAWVSELSPDPYIYDLWFFFHPFPTPSIFSVLSVFLFVHNNHVNPAKRTTISRTKAFLLKMSRET